MMNFSDTDGINLQQNLRAGETGGRRPQTPRPDDKKAKKTAPPRPDPRPVERVQAKDLVVTSEIEGFRFLRRPAVHMFAALVAALLGLYVLSQVSQVLNNLQALPLWPHIIMLCLMLVMLGVVLFVFARMCLVYFRVPVQQTMSIKRIHEFDEAKRYGDEAYIAARNVLKDYLAEFRVDDAVYEQQLKKWGMNAEAYAAYSSALRRLNDTQRPIDARQWIVEFHDKFAVHLNNVAESRCKYYALLVGFKTALSPWNLVDICAVLYNSTLLVRDLCLLYKRRAGRRQSLGILLQVAFNMYIGGEMQGAMQRLTAESNTMQEGASSADAQLSESISESIRPHAGGLVNGFREGINKIPGLKLVAGKLAEGGFNYLIMMRLGRRITKVLAPITQ